VVADEVEAVDELRAALELATDDELRDLTQVMFERKFNPLDYVTAPDPIVVQSRDRQAWIDALEDRFRFLAADGFTVLRRATEEVTYREVVMRVCHYLKIAYQTDWTTAELEAEIFLWLLGRAWQRLSVEQQEDLSAGVRRSLQASTSNALTSPRHLPPALLRDPVRLVLEGSSAIAMSAVVRPLVLRHIAYQFSVQMARYQAARALGSGAAALGGRVATQAARRGMVLTAARYGAARSVLAVVGPALWMWFLADLGWRAIATNYGRIIPAVFALAQIRLTRGDDAAWYYQPA
jgi:uncharacterized protein YaaW (UPF0174 family)